MNTDISEHAPAFRQSPESQTGYTPRAQKARPQRNSLVHPHYRPDIDGLRAVAVLLVVVYHAFPNVLPGGYIGVDVFFVISGLLISTIIFSSLERSSFSIVEFYQRRINRIFPALLAVMLACLTFGWVALFPDEFQQLGKHIAGGAGFASNIVLWRESGYFDSTSDVKPLLHLWSLGIEEQFYIVFPLIAYAGWKLRFNKLAWVLAALLASFALNIWFIRRDVVTTFFLPPTRAWELLIGSALACILMRSDQSGVRPVHAAWLRMPNVFSWAGLALIVAPAFFLKKNIVFPGWWAVLPCLGAAFMIHAGPRAWLNRVVLSSKSFVWVGLISFPLYLWHWPLLSFARIVEGETPSVTMRLALVASAILLATGTYFLIERPLKNVAARAKTIVLLVCMGVIGACGYYAYSHDGLPQRPMAKASEKFHSQFSTAIWQYTLNDQCTNQYKLEDSRNYAWWFCMSNSSAPPAVMIIGNSFANHLYPALANNDQLATNSILNVGACSIDIPKSNIDELNRVAPTSPCASERAKDQLEFIKEIIRSSGTVKYAILAGLVRDQTPDSIAAIENFVAFLKANNVKPIVFVPHVSAYKDLRSCFARPFKAASTEACSYPVSEREALYKAFSPLLEALSRSAPDVAIFDQNDVHCDAEKCSMVIDGMPVFRDQYSHYSLHATEKLGVLFAGWAKHHAPLLLPQR